MARSPRGGAASAEWRRLVEGEGTAKERLLLQAGIDEAPASRAGRQRTLVALGIAAGASTLASSAPGALEVSRGLVAVHAKWVLFGVAGAAAIVGGVELTSSPASAPLVVPPVAASHRAPSAVPTWRQLRTDAVAAPPSLPPTPPSRRIAPPTPQHDAPGAVAPSNRHRVEFSVAPREADLRPGSDPEATRSSSELVAQVAALDRARAALRSGRARQSVALLDSFDRSYPDSSLAPEVTVVRVSALLALGQRAQATRLVRGYCRLGGRDAYGQRLMALVGLDETACEDSRQRRDRSE